MNARTLILASAILALPGAIAAQTSVQADASARGTVRGGSAEASHPSTADAALRAAVRADLPEKPVRQAIARAEARGASRAETDRAAVDAYTRLRVARESIRREREEAPSDGEVTAGAEALLNGAAAADLRTVRDHAPEGRPLTVSLRALAGLTARGVSGSEAAARVAARLESGASDRAIASLAGGAGAAAALGGVSAGAAGALDATAAAGGLLGGVGASVGAGVGGVIR